MKKNVHEKLHQYLVIRTIWNLKFRIRNLILAQENLFFTEGNAITCVQHPIYRNIH